MQTEINFKSAFFSIGANWLTDRSHYLLMYVNQLDLIGKKLFCIKSIGFNINSDIALRHLSCK
jgi:hypothetical protein